MSGSVSIFFFTLNPELANPTLYLHILIFINICIFILVIIIRSYQNAIYIICFSTFMVFSVYMLYFALFCLPILPVFFFITT